MTGLTFAQLQHVFKFQHMAYENMSIIWRGKIKIKKHMASCGTQNADYAGHTKMQLISLLPNRVRWI